MSKSSKCESNNDETPIRSEYGKMLDAVSVALKRGGKMSGGVSVKLTRGGRMTDGLLVKFYRR